ncbi:MAG: ferredoxin III, nif-specific [Nitrospirota bacterium]
MSIKGLTSGGREWAPAFVLAIDQQKCIGCGRCYKACGRSVLEPIDKPFSGDDEYGDDMGNKVMSIKDKDDCIGCGACARICTKKCYTHKAA